MGIRIREFDTPQDFTCPVCGKEIKYLSASRDFLYGDEKLLKDGGTMILAARTYDCQGIPYRMVCLDCFNKIMVDGEGYDGEIYTRLDENF